MMRKLIPILAFTGIVMLPASALAEPTVSGMTNTLSATPRTFRGNCPAVITFNGTITVNGEFGAVAPTPVQIGYQFLRSDGATGPINYYTITAPGTQSVSTTWTLGGPALPSYGGWEQLKAWPTRHDGGFGYAFSPKASFRVVCAR
jgi:hypothetical protein